MFLRKASETLTETSLAVRQSLTLIATILIGILVILVGMVAR